MGFFDNMLEINNNFLLIGLIVVAITCIYLLYSNLTKVNDSASLKTTINNLIQQNKKRDEIINFLLERIENLEHGLPKLTEDSNGTGSQSGGTQQLQTAEPVTAELDDLLDNIEPEPSQTVPANELTELLESINPPDSVLDVAPVINDSPVVIEAIPVISTEEQPSAGKLAELTLDDLETEFEGMFDNVPATNPEVELDIQSQSAAQDIDIVSVVLEADDIGNMADYEINVADVPKAKDKLNAKYTVKQLKQIAQKMNLNTKGNKTDLVERIHGHLSGTA